MKSIFVLFVLVFLFASCRTRSDDDSPGAPQPTPKSLQSPGQTANPTNTTMPSSKYVTGVDLHIMGSWVAKPYTFKTLKLKFEAEKMTLGVACTDSGKLMEASESTAEFEISKKTLKVNETLEPIRSDANFRCDAKMSGIFSFRMETENEFVLIATPTGETRFTRAP